MTSKRVLLLFLCLAAGAATAFALHRWREHSPERLAEILASEPDPERRKRALEELAQVPGDQNVDAMISALSDRDAGVQRAAATALGKKKATRAVDAMIAAMKSQPPNGQVDFAMALGEIGDPKGAAAILEAVRAQEKDYGRISILVALGKLDAGAVDALMAALKDSDPRVRECAASGLGGIAFKLRGQSEEQANAKTQRAVDAVCVLLKDPEIAVRRAAADALGSLHDPRAVTPLIAALADPDPDLAEILARVLSYFPREAVDPLIAALRGEEFSMRRGAAETLGAIAGGDLTQPGDRDAVAKAIEETEQGLLRNNMEFLAGAYLYYIRKGQSMAVPKLINTLDALGDKRMAKTFLNCGEKDLAEAAKGWAKDHGMTVNQRSGGSGYKWGGK